MSEGMVYQGNSIQELVSGLTEHLEQIGYRPSSLKTYGGILERLQDYCAARRGTETFTMDLGREFVQDCYGAVLGERDRLQNISRAVHMLADFQRFGMVFKQQNVRRNGFSPEYTQLFERFLESRRKSGIASSSVAKYRNFLFRFERFLKDRGVDHFHRVALHHVNVYVESMAGYSKNTISAALGMLRLLFDYARENGYHAESYSDALPTVRFAQTSRLPVTFTADEVERILENVDTHNSIGKRNYAIILLAAKLGLRVSDVLGLRFDSIDWDAKTLSIKQQKTGVPLTLPLPEDVGWSIINYLKHGRPETTCETIFVRHNAPYDAMTSHFQKDIQRAVQKAGIKVPADKHFGMHSFRHSIASTMLSQGATLSEIAQILGHTSTEVTEDYISLTPTLLRECALEVNV